MIPYWLLFVIWALGSLQFTRGRLSTNSTKLYVIVSAATVLMIGLRFEVGGDWTSYQAMYNDIYYRPFHDALSTTDPGYAALNWLAIQLDLDIWAVNLACGALFIFGIARLGLRQPNPWLAMLVAVPYFIIVVAMGYTRQAAAIGIICVAFADADDTKFLRLTLLVAIAALFHKTAILILPVLLLPLLKRNLLVGAFGALAFIVLFSLLLGSQSDVLIANYAQSDYDSQGAAVRISMNVLAGVLFLLMRKRMPMLDYQKSLWTYSSILSLVSLVALTLLSASSGVDRLALFLIPVQMITYSRLPYVLPDRSVSIPLLFSVIGYSLAVQFVWLNFADNAQSWLPYSTVLSPALE